MKLNRKQLRKMILKEMSAAAYGQGMDKQDALVSQASFPVSDSVIQGLLMVVGNDNSDYTQDAISAIYALQDASSPDELKDAIYNVESYISTALRQKYNLL